MRSPILSGTFTLVSAYGNNAGACGLTHRVLSQYSHCVKGPCNLPGVHGLCVLRREKLVSYLIYLHTHTHNQSLIIYCYLVCTHNRIRSPRLAAFGRIEIRWVREVGKFGPYLRYKDWLRRWTHIHIGCDTLWELARTRGIRLFN